MGNKQQILVIQQILAKGVLDENEYNLLFAHANDEVGFRSIINIDKLMNDLGVDEFKKSLKNKKIKVSLNFALEENDKS